MNTHTHTFGKNPFHGYSKSKIYDGHTVILQLVALFQGRGKRLPSTSSRMSDVQTMVQPPLDGAQTMVNTASSCLKLWLNLLKPTTVLLFIPFFPPFQTSLQVVTVLWPLHLRKLHLGSHDLAWLQLSSQLILGARRCPSARGRNR